MDNLLTTTTTLILPLLLFSFNAHFFWLLACLLVFLFACVFFSLCSLPTLSPSFFLPRYLPSFHNFVLLPAKKYLFFPASYSLLSISTKYTRSKTRNKTQNHSTCFTPLFWLLPINKITPKKQFILLSYFFLSLFLPSPSVYYFPPTTITSNNKPKIHPVISLHPAILYSDQGKSELA